MGKIARQEEHYAKKSSIFNPIVGGCQLTVFEFDGQEMLWSAMAEEEREMEISLYISCSEGQINCSLRLQGFGSEIIV